MGERDLSARDGTRMDRRTFLRLCGVSAAVAGTPALLSACGTAASVSGPASGGKLKLPTYVPHNVAKPDIPSVNGSNVGYLSYPKDLVRTVKEVPGKGGTYTTITPIWTSIPPGKANPYYEAVNKALGAKLVVQPANGITTYPTMLAPLFAGNKLPDWIDIPTWMMSPLNMPSAVPAKFADLTEYLSGDNIKKYPNLAAIPPAGWKTAVWNDRIMGIPCNTNALNFNGAVFYRADILAKHGIKPDVKSSQDLFDIGKEINDPKRQRWAFDEIFGYLYQAYGLPTSPNIWLNGPKDSLVAVWESDGIIEAMEFERKIIKSGLMNPDAVAMQTGPYKQRFYSGQVVIEGDGVGAWGPGDATTGRASDPSYVRRAFDPWTADGTGTPTFADGNGTQEVSYLSKRLSKTQIEELLNIANYLAAPFGSVEYQLLAYGVEGRDFKMKGGGPVTTTAGTKYGVGDSYIWLASTPAFQYGNPGYEADVVRAYLAWQQNAGKYTWHPPFWDANVPVPASLSAAQGPTAFTGTPSIMDNYNRGRATLADYREAVKRWQTNGGNQLRKFYLSYRDKYGEA